MSDTHDTDAPNEPKRLGLLAQFAGPDELIEAAGKITDDGYKKVEAYSPFAIIGIDDALKAKGTILPWIVVTMGATGCLIALAMQLYMNGIEGTWWLSGYHFQISGKPGFSSLPAFIPVTFEVIVLLSAFGAFFGMLGLNQLPKLFNPLFRNERFADATTDGFFLFVEATDAKYAETETEAYLQSIGATAVDAIDEQVEGHAVPAPLYMAGACAACVALLPVLYIWASSSTTSTLPRISFFRDMETQAKFKAQTTSTLFADGRAARKPLRGVVARGSGMDDTRFYFGIEPDSIVQALPSGEYQFASHNGGKVPARLIAEEEAAEEAPAEAPAEPPEPNWTKEFPDSLKLDKAFIDRGEQRYNIHCAVCHGLAGGGDGLVSQRAVRVSGATWQPPTNLHIESVLTQPVGRIFDTISNGRRKMPGYKDYIAPEDRWAIVLYIKALQRSQTATAADVPAEKLPELSN